MSGARCASRVVWLAVLALLSEGGAQEDEGPYRGKFIGKLNSYHHQVSGSVYAVDEWTLLVEGFSYDGTGEDAFFWAGDAGRVGPQGFIVPDPHGTTNVLERYFDAEVLLRLPDNKRVSRLKWFAVYDIQSQNAFADVYLPEEFDPPAPHSLPALAAPPALSSLPLQVLTADTILIPEFRYDGSGREVYFWTGVGPQPSSKGFKIPDEYGYLEPLGAYDGADVTLRLPGGRTVFEVSWVAVWDAAERRALAAVLLPEAVNVPPAAARALPYASSLPRCRQLHNHYQVSWDVFGPQITIELAAQIAEDEYMAFGISGSQERSTMMGADVAVVRYDARQQRGLAADYNVTARARCARVLDARVGVCRDDTLGGIDSNQVFTARREDGLTIVSYRRSLRPDEPMDLEWAKERDTFVVWAVGRLDSEGEPGFHRLFHKHDLQLNLTADQNDCFPFVKAERAEAVPWDVPQLFDPALRVFRLAVGGAGGARGLRARGARGAPDAGAAPLAWYVNGQLAPDLQLRRGLQYALEVRGGADPHSPTAYHPLVVRAGGRVLAGVQYSRRGQPHPVAAGALCLGRPTRDTRRDAAFASFRAYNRSLSWECPAAAPARLLLAPNSSWPDLVYYESFTTPGMGGRMFIVDRHKRSLGRDSAAPALSACAALVLTAALWTARLGPQL